ncbi:MAG: hypothetical protein GXZ07_00690 [Firmicutes bacterium]|nr:hypothetical protein [Bacillota bacterium]
MIAVSLLQEEVSLARQMEMDIVVRDHHLPLDVLPPAVAVINPQRIDCPYPFKMLCAAGIAYKLVEAILSRQFRIRLNAPGDLWEMPILPYVFCWKRTTGLHKKLRRSSCR